MINVRNIFVITTYLVALASSFVIFRAFPKDVYGQSIDVCNQNQFSMGFVLLAKNEGELTQERIDKLTHIKNLFPEYFSSATRNLAAIDTSNPVLTMVDDGNIISGDIVVMNKMAEKYFSLYPDEFDFISVYTTFPTSATQYHISVYNPFNGIGTMLRNYRYDFGSSLRLLGINYLSSIDMYDENSYRTYNGLLHETGHQWCCYVGDNFARGENGAHLEIIQQGIHFYRGLDSPYDNSTAMNSDHWVNNGDDTYRRETKQEAFKYHDFQLYFMGLKTPAEFSEDFILYDAGLLSDFNPNNALLYKTVGINDIIAAEGPRECIPEPTITPTPSPLGYGDADGDNDVDLNDYSIWISEYDGNRPEPIYNPDFNNDGQVDGEDFVIWLTNYGT